MPQRVVVSNYDEQGLPAVVNTDSSGKSATTVTPNDSTVLPVTKGLYVGATGNVVVTMNGADITFTNLSGGMIHPISVTKVKATGTTATSILAIY